jgi:hypothetical protein
MLMNNITLIILNQICQEQINIDINKNKIYKLIINYLKRKIFQL